MAGVDSNRFLKIGACRECGFVKMLFKSNNLCEKCNDIANETSEEDVAVRIRNRKDRTKNGVDHNV